MSDKTKKILLITLFAVVVIGGFVALYFVFFKPTEKQTIVQEQLTPLDYLQTVLPNVDFGQIGVQPEQPTNVAPAQIPTVAGGEETLVTPIVDKQVEQVSDTKTGDAFRYYDPNEGVFYRVEKDGTTRKLSDKVFRGVESATWSSTDDKAVLEFPDGTNVMYDFKTDKQYTLPEEMEDFGFNATGTEIAYKFNAANPDSRWLGVSNPDGTSVRGVNFMGENGTTVDVNWSPEGTVLGTYEEASDMGRTTVSFLGLNNENFKGMIVEGRGFEGIWSPNGKQMLYSVYSTQTAYNPVLWIANASGEDIGTGRKEIGLQTWANKCDFNASGSTIYCAVPDSLPDGTGLVPSNANELNYSFYQIDVASGSMSRVAIPTLTGGETFAVDSMFVTDAEDTIVFTESKTGKVYTLRLK